MEALEATLLVQLSRNLVRMFVLIKSWTSVKIGHVGSKSRSLGEILEKPFVHSRGHIFSLIIMKLRQNVCLDEISDENDLVTYFLTRHHMKSQTRLKMGHVGSKTRSLGQILEKPCVHSKGQVFSRIT